MTHPTRIECVDCSRLPALPANEAEVDEDVEYRPRVARPIHRASGPRKPRCSTHHFAKKRESKVRKQETRTLRTYGLPADEWAALLAFQGGRCAVCQRAYGRSRRLAVDHDHELAKQHDHSTEQGCPDCVRSLACDQCNRIILGRYDVEALQRAIGVLTDPPFQRMRREAAS